MWETVLQVKRLKQQYQSTEGTKNTQITNNTISEHTKTQFFISLIIVYCDHLHIFPYSSLSFYPRDAMLARVIEIATCLSVRASVCHAPVLCQNEEC